MPAPPGVGPYALFGVEVDDVDAAHDRAVALGAASVVPPTDNPGGVRSAYLRDPDGVPLQRLPLRPGPRRRRGVSTATAPITPRES